MSRVTIEEYGKYETAWCPGCGNFNILSSLKKALVMCDLKPHEVQMVSGIGQAAKTPYYLNVNHFDGLHGRGIPAALAMRLSNPNLKVIYESGDGCTYGEGGNHFLACLRRNPDITLFVHDNMVYGLTKGQSSPTSGHGFVTKAQPAGNPSNPFNPVALAVLMGANFVARAYSGKPDQLANIMAEAIKHKGLSLVDILQPCVTFNKINTYQWFNERCSELPADYDPYNRETALKTAMEFGDTIPIGIIFKADNPTFEDNFSALEKGPLCAQPLNKENLGNVFKEYIA